MQEQHGEEAVARRRLLRRAGTVAAGVAGAGVVGAMVASPAQAAIGNPVLAGDSTNNGEGATTGLTSTAPGGTLELSNTATPVAGPSGNEVPPSLRLVPAGDIISANAPVGGLSIDTAGNIWVAGPDPFLGSFPEYVHTQRTSNTIVPIAPTRLIDTRNSAGRTAIMNPTGNLATNGQLLAGKTIQIDLSKLVFFGEAVFLNATVTGELANGYLTLWPTGLAKPITSNVNYRTGVDLSNYALIKIGSNANSLDVISVYSHQTTHVILDITAFVIGYGMVNPAFIPAAAATTTNAATALQGDSRAAQAKTAKPSWK